MPTCQPVDPAFARALGPVQSPVVVYELLAPDFLPLKNERAWMLLLDGAKFLQVKSTIARGQRTEVEIDLDWSLACVRSPATRYAILAHNHPPGYPAWPSWADARLTRDMGRAAALQGVELLDHVILARGEFFSFYHQKGSSV